MRKQRAPSGEVRERGAEDATTSRLPRLLKPAEAAAILRTTTATLKVERHKSSWGLPFYKRGSSVLYAETDILAYLERCRQGGDEAGSDAA